MKRLSLTVLTFVILSACTKTVWIHPQKSQDQYRMDRWDCEQDLASRCQPDTPVFTEKSGYFGLSTGKDTCAIEKKDVDQCMVSKHGWVKKEVPK